MLPCMDNSMFEDPVHLKIERDTHLSSGRRTSLWCTNIDTYCNKTVG